MRGIGSMIHQLSGGNKNDPSKYFGKKIISANMKSEDPDCVVIEFDDGISIRIVDAGQSCCEKRYMTTDDNLADLVGQTIVSIEARDGSPGADDGYGEHEVVFVVIQGDKSAVTIATHNEHNGYYGGFALEIIESAAPK